MTDSREPAPFADEGGRAARAPRAARRRPSAGEDEARKRVREDDRLSTRRPNPGAEGAGGGIAVRWLPVEALTPDKRNARIHSARQVARIADSIAAFGFNVPILVDDKGGVLAGHGRLLAAKRLGLREAPTITLGHLNEARRRAFVIADNRLSELASWDDARLGAELEELKSLDLDFGVELTGFEMSEIDLRIEARPSASPHPAAPGSQSGGRAAPPTPHPAGCRPPPPGQASPGAGSSPARGEGRTAVARAGDTWDLGPHRLHCGDAAGARAFLALDAAIRQWQSLTKDSARLHPTGETFDSVERSRRSESPVQ
jgi:ParB-like nuclease domain